MIRMKQTLGIALLIALCAACSSDDGAPTTSATDPNVTETLRQLDRLASQARRSTLAFSKTEQFSQHAKITFTVAFGDWREVRFQVRLASFNPSQLKENEHLGPALSALVAAADAWVLYFEAVEPAVEGEGPIEKSRVDQLLLEAKKKDVAAQTALNEAIQEAGPQ